MRAVAGMRVWRRHGRPVGAAGRCLRSSCIDIPDFLVDSAPDLVRHQVAVGSALVIREGRNVVDGRNRHAGIGRIRRPALLGERGSRQQGQCDQPRRDEGIDWKRDGAHAAGRTGAARRSCVAAHGCMVGPGRLRCRVRIGILKLAGRCMLMLLMLLMRYCRKLCRRPARQLHGRGNPLQGKRGQ